MTKLDEQRPLHTFPVEGQLLLRVLMGCALSAGVSGGSVGNSVATADIRGLCGRRHDICVLLSVCTQTNINKKFGHGRGDDMLGRVNGTVTYLVRTVEDRTFRPVML